MHMMSKAAATTTKHAKKRRKATISELQIPATWPRRSRSRVSWAEDEELKLLKAVLMITSSQDSNFHGTSRFLQIEECLNGRFSRIQILDKIKELKRRYESHRRDSQAQVSTLHDQSVVFEICDKIWGNEDDDNNDNDDDEGGGGGGDDDDDGILEKGRGGGKDHEELVKSMNNTEGGGGGKDHEEELVKSMNNTGGGGGGGAKSFIHNTVSCCFGLGLMLARVLREREREV